MIDTVRFKVCASPIKPAFGWEVQEGTRLSNSEGRFVPWSFAVHKETGLRVQSSDGYASILEVSLPKLLSGHNGRLLRPHEINMAYHAAVDLASDVVEDVRLECITRYDLVHHFRGAMCDFLASLRGITHSKVRRKQLEYFDTGITWPGKDCLIRLYDKKMESERIAGMIQRLEFQLRGTGLRDVWSYLGGFDPDALYEHYKLLCNGFRGSRPVPRLGSLAELLCLLEKHNVTIEGTDVVSRFINAKSRRTKYRLRAEIKAVKLEYFNANFMEHLPGDLKDLVYIDCSPPAADLFSEVA
jgi:hypothetical protein